MNNIHNALMQSQYLVGLVTKTIQHILNIEKQWVKHRSLSNHRQGPMLYPLFFNVSNTSVYIAKIPIK